MGTIFLDGDCFAKTMDSLGFVDTILRGARMRSTHAGLGPESDPRIHGE